MDERRILNPVEADLPPDAIVSLMSKRMMRVGTTSESGGNPTKRLRFEIGTPLSASIVRDQLRAITSSKHARHLDRLPTEELEKVTAEHIWQAIQSLRDGSVRHGFGPSTDFDLIDDDGARLPPKAVFGVAASEALGFEVKPSHFSGGLDTPCFRILRRAGYDIVSKEGHVREQPLSPSEDEAEAWEEGTKVLTSHVRAERKKGATKAKKARFLREHGRLFCERCQFDPRDDYDSVVSDACIEVHHREVQVSEMKPEHKTRLDDLMCICANCHRVTHKELREAAKRLASEIP
jgi:5-methylcytosine-specific restriction protein A